MAVTDGPPAGGTPGRGLSALDGAVFLIGVVVGVGLFRTPPLAAAGVESGGAYLLLWALGGLAALIGALCYAELGSAYPDSGGEYHFLTRAYGRTTGLFFVWARGSVIQTGSIAVVAFVYGDYANQVIDLGAYGSALHGASAILLLTLLNLTGRTPAKRVQHVVTALEVAALLAIVVAALALVDSAPAGAAPPPPVETGAAGLAMIFILLTYGGWNDAAYLAGEVRDPGRNMVRVLVGGVLAVTLLYLAVNAALLAALGLDGIRGSEAVAADLMRIAIGDWGAIVLSLMVGVAALSTINGTMFTGARLYFALGRDTGVIKGLGGWNARREAPAVAIVMQGMIALALVGFGAAARDGFQTMVDYTAPVFWLFMLLVGASLIVLRRRDPERARPFKVPLYPILPTVYCLTCLWLLHSSLAYTGPGALLGVAVLALGIPFVLAARKAGGQKT